MIGYDDNTVGNLTFKRISTNEALRELRNINSILFPQAYNDLFYKKLVKNPNVYFYLVYMNKKVIGTCSFIYSGDIRDFPKDIHQIQKLEESKTCCYIMTLGVLGVHRRMGHGSIIWKFIKEQTESHYFLLHVQEANELAIKFYQGHGFQVISTEPIRGYYKKLENSDALIMAGNFLNFNQ